MNFREVQYDHLQDVYEAWWQKKINRPLISVVLKKGKQYSKGELLEYVYDTQLPCIEVAKVYEEQFNNQEFLGDAFPFYYMRTTGLLGVFMGQEWEVSLKNGTVWYKELDKEFEDLSFQVDTKHILYQRMMELNRVFQEYFDGAVVLGGANLGGICDVYHSIRGMQNTIYDFVDDPDTLKSYFHEIKEEWRKTHFALYDAVDIKRNHGYTHWTPILSQKTYDMIQADLAFMIGPDDYEEFLEPLIKEESAMFGRSMFHLDGPGFLKHLDRILSIDSLDGVQWIPGAGVDKVNQWDEFYHTVDNSGKLLQVFIEPGEAAFIEEIIAKLSHPEHVIFICNGLIEEKEVYEALLAKYQVS